MDAEHCLLWLTKTRFCHVLRGVRYADGSVWRNLRKHFCEMFESPDEMYYEWSPSSFKKSCSQIWLDIILQARARAFWSLWTAHFDDVIKMCALVTHHTFWIRLGREVMIALILIRFSWSMIRKDDPPNPGNHQPVGNALVSIRISIEGVRNEDEWPHIGSISIQGSPSCQRQKWWTTKQNKTRIIFFSFLFVLIMSRKPYDILSPKWDGTGPQRQLP